MLARSCFSLHLQSDPNPLPGTIRLGLGSIVFGTFRFNGCDSLDFCRQALGADPHVVTAIEVMPQYLCTNTGAGRCTRRIDGTHFRFCRGGVLRGLGSEVADRNHKEAKEAKDEDLAGQAPVQTDPLFLGASDVSCGKFPHFSSGLATKPSIRQFLMGDTVTPAAEGVVGRSPDPLKTARHRSVEALALFCQWNLLLPNES